MNFNIGIRHLCLLCLKRYIGKVLFQRNVWTFQCRNKYFVDISVVSAWMFLHYNDYTVV